MFCDTARYIGSLDISDHKVNETVRRFLACLVGDHGSRSTEMDL